MARKRLMTEANYRKLFNSLVERFGPHWTWRLKTYPKGQKSQFDDFKARMSALFGVTAGSVDNYIAWGYTKQSTVQQRKDSDYRPTWLRAKYHAFESGFIDNDYLVPIA